MAIRKGKTKLYAKMIKSTRSLLTPKYDISHIALHGAYLQLLSYIFFTKILLTLLIVVRSRLWIVGNNKGKRKVNSSKRRNLKLAGDKNVIYRVLTINLTINFVKVVEERFLLTFREIILALYFP